MSVKLDWRQQTDAAVKTLFSHLAQGRTILKRADLREIGEHLGRHWDEDQVLELTTPPFSFSNITYFI